jgi:hypothetical protein
VRILKKISFFNISFDFYYTYCFVHNSHIFDVDPSTDFPLLSSIQISLIIWMGHRSFNLSYLSTGPKLSNERAQLCQDKGSNFYKKKKIKAQIVIKPVLDRTLKRGKTLSIGLNLVEFYTCSIHPLQLTCSF